MALFIQALRPAIALLIMLTLITGVVYPLTVTGIAQLAFPAQANGSIITVDGQARGSALIGQEFSDPRYFWGRRSATSPAPYTAFNQSTLTGSAGANLGPLSTTLAEATQARVRALRSADPQASLPIPVDLITASASGLDPNMSPAAAFYQIRRVALARGVGEAQIAELVAQYTSERDLGILGEPRVKLVELNLALDARYPLR